MAPRNRHANANASPSTSPSSTPPSTGLTKRQRQALRIQRPPLASSPPTESSITESPAQTETDLPSAGTSPASLPVEGIRIMRHASSSLDADERERASPSKYPTPLPDDEDDELPVPVPLVVEEPALFEVGDIDGDRGVMEPEVPVGRLIDVLEEDGEEPSPERVVPEKAEPAQVRGVEKADRPKETKIAIRPTDTDSDIAIDTSARKSRRRNSPASSSAPSPAPAQAQAHLRAPEAPRHNPSRPLAVSALSHTLRFAGALAKGTQAVTSTATAYATAYAHGHPQPQAQTQVYATHPYVQVEAQRGEEGRVRAQRGEDGEEDERILSARWDEVEEFSSTARTTRTRRLLTLTYAAGVQVWDASVLGGVEEVLNLRISSSPASLEKPRSSVDTLRAVEGAVGVASVDTVAGKDTATGREEREDMRGPILGAAILPSLPARSRGEGEDEGGLELGILTPHALYVYALRTGSVRARAAFPSTRASSSSAAAGKYAYGGDAEPAIGTPCAFEAAEKLIVITTHTPPALVVLARPSLRVLHVFPASQLAVAYPPSSSSPADLGKRLSFSSYTSGSSPPYGTSPPTSTATPHPGGSTLSPTSPSASSAVPTSVFALHGRLLAFIAPPPATSPSPFLPSMDSRADANADVDAGLVGVASWGRSLGRFFSRSAPAGAASAASALAAAAGVFGTGSPPGSGGNGSGAGGADASAWVRVVDLGPLFAGAGGKGMARPRDVHAFAAGRTAVGALSFARDGTSLFVVRRDGLGAGVWAIRPEPLSSSLRSDDAHALPTPARVYTLRRGRTGAVVESLASARDGRWVALATHRRTVHVFAVNPYGGLPDGRSHLGRRVRDAEEDIKGAGGSVSRGAGEEGVTEVHALVRMRLPAQQRGREGEPPVPPPAPLAVAFVPASSGGALRSPRSPASPGTLGGIAGVQDVLVFDPADGVLSLRRLTLTLEVPHTHGMPISVSLPSARGRLSMSASPPSYVRGGIGAGGGAAVGHGGEIMGSELAAREAVVATWSLRRKRGWGEIRRAEGVDALPEAARSLPVKEDWLAQAELSTFTRAPRALPRAIYLSHQFAFYTLGEDYHALVRGYQLAICGSKIEVRRQVQVSAFAYAESSAAGEAFVEGYTSSTSTSSPRAIRRHGHESGHSRALSASFDEPLASALAAGGHYRDARPPPVLPMLPNGSPASSFMPVRAVAVAGRVGENVAEGLGRLRREMRHHQRQRALARSPPAMKGGGGDDVDASVPLEFDEEDEDFAGPVPPGVGGDDDVFLRVHADREDEDAVSATTSPSRNGEESVASVSTPATSAHPLEDEHSIPLALDADADGTTEGEWDGWAAQAVEEAEKFDDISVVGFLDEEQAAMRAEVQKETEARRSKGTRGKRRR